jgi:hypothetical protein
VVLFDRLGEFPECGYSLIAEVHDAKRLDIDNVLKISNDGRNVSLDPRLAHIEPPAISRPTVVADQVMRILNATRHNIYRDPDSGVEMPIRGGLQIVFCDRGTPTADPAQFTIYGAIRDELITRGIPGGAIRFIHDAVKPADKLKLFRQCTNSEVSVHDRQDRKNGHRDKRSDQGDRAASCRLV